MFLKVYYHYQNDNIVSKVVGNMLRFMINKCLGQFLIILFRFRTLWSNMNIISTNNCVYGPSGILVFLPFNKLFITKFIITIRITFEV